MKIIRKTNNTRSKKKHFLSVNSLRIIGLLVSVALIFAGVIVIVNYWEKSRQPKNDAEVTERQSDEIEFNGQKYAPREGLDTTVILGVDRSDELLESSGGVKEGEIDPYLQSDLILLVVADPERKTYRLIHINRDTMALVTVLDEDGEPVRKETMQITLAHAYGDRETTRCKNTMEAVSGLLGDITIDHYVSLSMDSVPILNDLVGGVTLTAMDTINENIIKGETVTLMGENALRYVRARSSLEDSTNLHRMERQKQYLEEFKNKFSAAAKQNNSFAFDSLLKVNDYLTSDCTVERLSQLVNTLSTYEMTDYLTLEGENRKGAQFIEYYPDQDKLMEMIVDVFYEPVK